MGGALAEFGMFSSHSGCSATVHHPVLFTLFHNSPSFLAPFYQVCFYYLTVLLEDPSSSLRVGVPILLAGETGTALRV